MARATIRKWAIVAVYWIVQTLIAHALLTGLIALDSVTALRELPGILTDADAWTYTGPVCAALMVFQAGFLWPVRAPGRAESTRSRVIAAIIPGFASSLLAAFLLTAPSAWWIGAWGQTRDRQSLWPWLFLSVLALGFPIATWAWARRLRRGVSPVLSCAIASFAAAVLAVGVFLSWFSVREHLLGRAVQDWSPWGPAVVLWCVWLISTPLIIRFARGKPTPTVLSRLASLLLVGTIAETAAVIPFDVMVRRRTDCYCGEGTFFALTICATVGLLAFGPAVFLLPLARRRKRNAQGRCEVCGYDMRATLDAERCPECGAGWRNGVPEPAGD